MFIHEPDTTGNLCARESAVSTQICFAPDIAKTAL